MQTTMKLESLGQTMNDEYIFNGFFLYPFIAVSASLYDEQFVNRYCAEYLVVLFINCAVCSRNWLLRIN